MSFSNNSEDFFSGVVEMRPSLIASMRFCVIAGVIITLLAYGLIWFDSYSSDMKRTFLSRIMILQFHASMVYTLVANPTDLLRYIYGPLPKGFCTGSFFLKYYLVLIAILALDLTLLCRCLMISVLKNPAAFQDKFWSRFAPAWILLFSFIIQLVIMMQPGKDFAEVWICTGEDPSTQTNLEYKSLIIFRSMQVGSLLLHIVVGAAIKIYQRKIEKQKSTFHPRSKMYWIISTADKSPLNIFENVLAMSVFALAIGLQAMRRIENLALLNSYPGYITEHFFTFIRPSVIMGLLIVISLSKKAGFFPFLKREILDFIRR